jgi:hypothetical protein
MAPILDGLEGCIAYFDDVLIYGKSKEECEKNLIKALERFDKFNLVMSREKSKFFIRKIKYLGYIISEKGLEKDPEKVMAIQKTAAPTNVKELQSFLGMVQFYSAFIKNAAAILQPLYNLLNNNTSYHWTKACDEAFIAVKEQLVSEQTLIMLDPNLPLYLETDASPYGLGAILSHKIDGHLRPIGFYSRTLSKAEKNYAHIDREATAIFWATKKLYQYLYGREFILITDNKPLQQIFNPDKNLPSIATQRLLRYALHLRQFDYKVEYRPASQHTYVDYLSRKPTAEINPAYIDETDRVQEITINLIQTTVTAKDLKKATQEDPELLAFIIELQSAKTKHTEYSLHNGIVMRGLRVVIPVSLREYVLKELHLTHCGITKMKAIARSICYWKNIDADIERVVKSCQACALSQRQPSKAPIHHWETPMAPWQRIHADFAGPIHGKHILIAIDAYSKWVELFIFNKAPTSATTIERFKEMFVNHGLPYNVVTDIMLHISHRQNSQNF